MNITDTPEYILIKSFYGDEKAKRSQTPLINHIHEGLIILDCIESDLCTQKAYCLHPILQADEAIALNYGMDFSQIDPLALILTMEYRNIANQYLSKRIIQNIEEIKLSPLKEVNQMLIADKVQNRKDFELYHLDTHPRSKELQVYFANWLQRLGVSEEKYQFLIGEIHRIGFQA